ncbi:MULTISPECIES: aminodeoxychorismate/anthranilate synthase component II [Paraliobacillus]|uniref:anthranilate synthase component II n=1 Tax=Paraliobacillus TaxID=200903 RepID=UPI000E3BC73B|nr:MULTISPECIES: aminodeoxychorismate/anthranilate synthase component II [Paraliobacillus]
MILLIDNYDSFTYNLFQYISELDKEVQVVRNDKITIEEIKKMKPEAIILSPGPGTPEEAGICIDVVKQLDRTFPILGICLGHQAIGVAYGATVSHATHIKHGKTSMIKHTEDEVFQDLEEPLEVMRYHSLVVKQDTVPATLEITATSIDDDEIMGLKHNYLPVYGLQFHPESIGTNTGKQMLANFFETIKKERSYETIS